MSDDNTPTPPDPGQTVSSATDWFNAYMSLAQAMGAPGWSANHAALSAAFETVRIPSTAAGWVGALLGAMAQLAAAAVGALGDVKGDPNASEGMNALTSAAISDLLGVTVQLNNNTASGGPTVDPSQTGGALFNALSNLFGGLGQPITPDQGLSNAQTFLGFGTNFAIVTAFLGLLGGMFPFIHLDELKGFGEEIQHTLGLGRLTHTAVTPLVRNMIAQPLDLYLRQQLRPDRLAEAQLVRGLRNGDFTQDDVTTQLQQKGYTDDAIAFLLEDLSVKLGLSDLFLLLLNGDIQEQDVINNLTITGMPEDQAQLQLKATRLAAVKTQQRSLLSWAETAYIDGFITEDQWNSIVGNLMLDDLEETALRARIGWMQETPAKTLTESEIKGAIVDNVLSFDALDTWMTQQRMDQLSQTVMTWNVLEAIKNAENKVLFAKYKIQQLEAKGKDVPPWLTAAATPIP
jgi:hypothetical protein